MRHLALVLAALLLAGALAQAQTRGPAQKPPPHQPYDPVAVAIPPPLDEPGFIAFRKQLADIARRRVYADLAAVVVARGFFWDRDFGSSFDPSKTGVENLATAIGLEAGDGAGWGRLAGFAAEPSASSIALRASVVCGPPNPSYDESALDRLMETTKTDSHAWTYPRNADMTVRAAPRANGAIVETLGLNFVHVLGYEAGEGDSERERAAWARVATPSGKAGFIAPGTLRPLSAERLCYEKDITGRWRVAGYIGRGD
jgi:hypothetical protein